MGYWYSPKEKKRKRAVGSVMYCDPVPVWEITIERESGAQKKIYANTEMADDYFRAGFPVRLLTTSGKLKQYEERL